MRKRDFIKGACGAILLFLQKGIANAENTSKKEQQEANLEDKVKLLSLKIQRMEDVNAIQNLMSKMDYLYEAGLYEDRMKYIAQKTLGVSIEIGARGVFEGYESARRTLVDTEKYYERSHAAGMKKAFPNINFSSDFAGKFESNLLGTPVIEIAKDGKTAKGVWVSLMTVGKMHENEDKPHAMWIWWKIGADFVKEDGEWRIWHYVKNPVYATTYDKSWVDNAIARASGSTPGPVPSDGKVQPSHGTTADRPTSKLYNSYSITGKAELIPKPPEPYETFNDKDAYVYPSL